MPKLMYGFLFSCDIKELVDSDIEDYSDIISFLNDTYGTKDIVFGELDEDSDEFYCYAGIEITNDIYEDEDNKLFSMDLDQIKENDETLLQFIDENNDTFETCWFCNSPRIFFVK
jgi:hypothetical protein